MYLFIDDYEKINSRKIQLAIEQYKIAEAAYNEAVEAFELAEEEVVKAYSEYKKACSHPLDKGVKHAGGGGGLGSDRWIECSECGCRISMRAGDLTRERWDSYPGETVYHGSGN